MSEITIKKRGELWSAHTGEKIVASSVCRPCVVKLLLSLTKKSKHYKKIHVLDENDKLVMTYLTGVRDEDVHSSDESSRNL